MLITGAGGFLGWNVCNWAKQNFSVSGTYHTKEIRIFGVQTRYCDLTNEQEVTKLVTEIDPDCIIHTAAASDPNWCQQHPSNAHRINVQASDLLAKLSADLDIPYLFTSTDLVFDGSQAPYSEESQVNPVNIYGEQKVEAEQKIVSIHKKSIVCRMPLMFGDTPPGSKRFLQNWIEQLQAGKELSLFIDEYRTPVSALDAVKGLMIALENRPRLLHLGGRQRISRYDFGKLLIEVLQVQESQIKRSKQQDVIMAAPRPKDVSLDSQKAFSLGYEPGSIIEEMKRLACLKVVK